MGKQLWTPDEVLSRIQSLHQDGHSLSSGDVAEISPRLVSAGCRYFGSWGRAVEAAGIDYSSFVQLARREAYEKRAKWSKERIIERIRAMADKNEPLNTAMVSLKYADLYSAACSPRYFNGWANAVKAAGIAAGPTKPGQRTKLGADLAKWKAELLLERIAQIAGQDLKVDERVIQSLVPALYEATVRRFGSWEGAVHASQSSQVGDGNG